MDNPSIVRICSRLLCRHGARDAPSLVGAAWRSHPPLASATGLAWRCPNRDAGRPAGYSGRAAAGSLGRTRSSWAREVMASLAKTLAR